MARGGAAPQGNSRGERDSAVAPQLLLLHTNTHEKNKKIFLAWAKSTAPFRALRARAPSKKGRDQLSLKAEYTDSRGRGRKQRAPTVPTAPEFVGTASVAAPAARFEFPNLRKGPGTNFRLKRSERTTGGAHGSSGFQRFRRRRDLLERLR